MSTSDVAMTAPATSPIALEAADLAVVFFSERARSMFEMTATESETQRRAASDSTNSVSVLNKKSNALKKMKGPRSEPGMVPAGTPAEPQSNEPTSELQSPC